VIILIVVALVIVAITVIWLRCLIKTHGVLRVVARFAVGHHLDGKLRTDAGYLRRGVKVLHPTGHASRWAHLPHLHRAGIRWGVVVAFVATCVGLATNLRLTLAGLALAATATVAWCVRWTVQAVRLHAHHSNYVRPLHKALAPVVGVPLATKPKAWLNVPRDYATRDGAEVVITLPDHFTGTADGKKLITSIVSGKLAMEDISPDFQMAGVPRGVFKTSVPPPDKVPYASVADLIKSCPETEPLLGLGRARKPVHADLDADSPHVLFSMGSGGGKSVATRIVAAKVMYHGGVTLILDVKRMSHTWARGLPNVRYCRSIEEIHNACLWLKEEVDRRNELVDDAADLDGNVDHIDVGPRIVVLAEEMNATVNRLRAYWRKIKAKGDPGESPAVEALGDALFMGRAVKVNVEAVAQMFTARTAGGPEARENMGTRILGRYTMNNWRILVPEIWPMPRSSRKPGRVQVCIGGTAYETQIVFATPKETRELAMAGTVTQFPLFVVADHVAATPGPVISNRPELVAVPEPVGLAEAVESGLLPWSLESVRRASQRDPEFPEHVRMGTRKEKLYDPADLRAWASNRPRATVPEKEPADA